MLHRQSQMFKITPKSDCNTSSSSFVLFLISSALFSQNIWLIFLTTALIYLTQKAINKYQATEQLLTSQFMLQHIRSLKNIEKIFKNKQQSQYVL